MQTEQKSDTLTLTRVPKTQDFQEGKDVSGLPGPEFLVCILDTETTGLESAKDEIIEFGFQIIEADNQGSLYRVVDEDSLLNQPSEPISEVITQVTGITNEDLEGHKIDWRAMEERLSNVSVFVAHNSAFDRGFCEKYSDIFKGRHWGCSMAQVDYFEAFGLSTKSLEFIVFKACNAFYDAHRALDDVQATSFLLSHNDQNGMPLLGQVFKEIGNPGVLVRAVKAPFDLKDIFRERGYRWAAEVKAWQKFMQPDEALDEIRLFRDEQTNPKLKFTPKVFALNSALLFSPQLEKSLIPLSESDLVPAPPSTTDPEPEPRPEPQPLTEERPQETPPVVDTAVKSAEPVSEPKKTIPEEEAPPWDVD